MSGGEFWLRTSGTWMNLGTVLLGSLVGLGLHQRLPARLQQRLTQAVGLITLFIGLQLSGRLTQVSGARLDAIVIGLLALVLGGLLGELARLDDRLQGFGDWLQRQVRGSGRFSEGFVAASLLFCVGPMTLLGSLQNGLSGDARLLLLKATMDGISAVILASSYGIGVAASGLTILLYQGGLSLAAGWLGQSLADPATSPGVLVSTGCGGLMIVAIALNLLELARIPVAAFLPALVLGPLLQWLVNG